MYANSAGALASPSEFCESRSTSQFYRDKYKLQSNVAFTLYSRIIVKIVIKL